MTGDRNVLNPKMKLARHRGPYRSDFAWTSTMADDHTRALTTRHPITPTSPRCPSAGQPNPGRRSTYRRGKTVQTIGTTSKNVFEQDVNTERQPKTVRATIQRNTLMKTFLLATTMITTLIATQAHAEPFTYARAKLSLIWSSKPCRS